MCVCSACGRRWLARRVRGCSRSSRRPTRRAATSRACGASSRSSRAPGATPRAPAAVQGMAWTLRSRSRLRLRTESGCEVGLRQGDPVAIQGCVRQRTQRQPAGRGCGHASAPSTERRRSWLMWPPTDPWMRRRAPQCMVLLRGAFVAMTAAGRARLRVMAT